MRRLNVNRAGIVLFHGVRTVEAHMHLIRIHTRHHMGRRVADRDVPDQTTGNAVEYRKLITEPLGLINDRLISVGPHVVGIVHVDIGQGNSLGDLPGAGIYGNRGSWFCLVFHVFSYSASTQISPMPAIDGLTSGARGRSLG